MSNSINKPGYIDQHMNILGLKCHAKHLISYEKFKLGSLKILSTFWIWQAI